MFTANAKTKKDLEFRFHDRCRFRRLLFVFTCEKEVPTLSGRSGFFPERSAKSEQPLIIAFKIVQQHTTISFMELHSFHIPVMGLAFTIDTPIKVARFGIDSVVSIVQDRLVEVMRKHYYEQRNETYHPIGTHVPDYRAKRITDYLNLMHRIVQEQMDALRKLPFTAGNDLCKYFEMLPPGNPLQVMYREMQQATDVAHQALLQQVLKSQLRPGRIDVNIMTKLDNRGHHLGTPAEDGTEAVAALRGYANSTLTNSGMIFSAGMNPRLFNYLEQLAAFHPTGRGVFPKEVVIKVSDFRSALIQGKYLAKKGVWVSEFRIESGLNCGGHAFATDGFLLGPILEEFKTRCQELLETLHATYQTAAQAKGLPLFTSPHPQHITAQGGIGTAEEDAFLRHYYELDGTGWGSPFLLCPEATTVDDDTRAKLSQASTEEIILSTNSPLGVRFHYLKGTTSDQEKQARIDRGHPGSPCTEKHLAFNTEFSEEPICTASHKYQVRKLKEIASLNLSEAEYRRQCELITSRECLCVGLSNAACLSYNQTFLKRQQGVMICPGPNVAYFSGAPTLRQMTDHIYGRVQTLKLADDRPHMFIKELQLYIDHLKEQFEAAQHEEEESKRHPYMLKFSRHLLDGIAYYRALPKVTKNSDSFERGLLAAEVAIKEVMEGIPV